MEESSRILVWYFSGTGNAKFSAKQISEFVIENGIESIVYNIADKKNSDYDIRKNDTLVFCYPTHGFNAPPLILKFLWRFVKGNNPIYLANTRGGAKIYHWNTPGLNGIALWLPALIMKLKGYKIIGFRSLDMPSNWISLHPALRGNALTFINERTKKILHGFTNKIIQQKREWSGLFWIPFDIPLIPIAILYYFYGRFALAKTFYASYKCDDCEACIQGCPVSAIKKVSGRPYWTFNCESCMKCMNTCPKNAIETAHGFTILLWWLAFSFIPYLIPTFLVESSIISNDVYIENMDLIRRIIVYSMGLIVIFLGYRIFHQIIRIKLINKLFSLTSLTWFKFWGRYRKR